MNHQYRMETKCFCLRPLELSDSHNLLRLRNDPERGRFLNKTGQINDHEYWYQNIYIPKKGDYYFAIENKKNKQFEGAIAIYNQKKNKAEWGRWVVCDSSLAALPSVFLMYQIAFYSINLNEIYCLTSQNNKSVLSFHASCGLETTKIIDGYNILNGISQTAIEQTMTKKNWEEKSFSYLIKELEKLENFLTR